jgi:hypothetical protein
MRDLENEPEYQPYINGFSDDSSGFDFAIAHNLPYLDPTIAYFEVNEVTSKVVNVTANQTIKVKTKRPLEIG